jgi:hypothetical protein
MSSHRAWGLLGTAMTAGRGLSRDAAEGTPRRSSVPGHARPNSLGYPPASWTGLRRPAGTFSSVPAGLAAPRLLVESCPGEPGHDRSSYND